MAGSTRPTRFPRGSRSSPRSGSTTPSGWGRASSRSPPRSWPCSATPRPWSSAGSAPRSWRWRSGPPPSAARRWSAPPRIPATSCAWAPPAPSSGATSRSRGGGRGLPRPPSSTPPGSPRSAPTLIVPGRLELLADEPPVFIDAAHNPDGARALAEALPEVAGGRPVVALLAVLADKDAEGIVAALAPALDRVVCTETPRRWPEKPARRRLFGPSAVGAGVAARRALRGGRVARRGGARLRRRPRPGPRAGRRAAARDPAGHRLALRPGTCPGSSFVVPLCDD